MRRSRRQTRHYRRLLKTCRSGCSTTAQCPWTGRFLFLVVSTLKRSFVSLASTLLARLPDTFPLFYLSRPEPFAHKASSLVDQVERRKTTPLLLTEQLAVKRAVVDRSGHMAHLNVPYLSGNGFSDPRKAFSSPSRGGFWAHQGFGRLQRVRLATLFGLSSRVRGACPRIAPFLG